MDVLVKECKAPTLRLDVFGTVVVKSLYIHVFFLYNTYMYIHVLGVVKQIGRLKNLHVDRDKGRTSTLLRLTVQLYLHSKGNKMQV